MVVLQNSNFTAKLSEVISFQFYIDILSLLLKNAEINKHYCTDIEFIRQKDVLTNFSEIEMFRYKRGRI